MKNFLLLLFILAHFTGLAQTGAIRGFVFDSQSGEPLLCIITLEGTEWSTTTDENGYYGLNNIPAGDYYLTAAPPGYATMKISVTLRSGQILPKKINIDPLPQEQAGKSEPVNITITIEDIKRIPPIDPNITYTTWPLEKCPGSVYSIHTSCLSLSGCRLPICPVLPQDTITQTLPVR